jgi:uncharacterized protein (DUF2141 family)
MKYLTLFCFLFLAPLVYSQTCDLTISIPNLNSQKGEIQIGLYNKKEDFPKDDKQYKLFFIDVKTFSGKFTIKDLPKGEYAVALMHDENADKICNMNFLGIPKEGYGFSKNIRPILSAPSFNECKINLQSDMAITIKLLY